MAEFRTYEESRRHRPPPVWWTPTIDRKVLKELMKRNNYQAFLSHGGYFLLLAAVGVVSALLYQAGSLWAILAFFVYGTLFGMSNSKVHESLHNTPFRISFLNEIVYYFASAMEIRCPLSTRWSHMNHHSYTIIRDTDLEIQAPRPVKLWKVLIEFFDLFSLPFLLRTLVLHTVGIPTKEARRVVPQSEFWKVFWSSRFTLGLHLAVIALAIVLKSWLPILFFTLPRLYGGWLIWALILVQHSGLAEDVLDHRLNTRTIHLNPFLSFLYMHMEYHIEHHVFPTIPFHALAKFRRIVDSQMPKACTSLWDAFQELVPVLLKQRHDPNFFIHRELPDGGSA
ncbi:MAG: fatty acid desaturase [Spirochaetia bacterium]|jgi:fatty acid desaturase